MSSLAVSRRESGSRSHLVEAGRVSTIPQERFLGPRALRKHERPMDAYLDDLVKEDPPAAR